MSLDLESAINESVRYLNKPMWKATEYLLTNDSSWWGLSNKVFGAVSTLFSIPFTLVGESLHYLSHRYYQKPYLFYQSQVAQDKPSPEKFLSLNACMFQGGLPIPFGGVTPAESRMKPLENFLKGQKADIISLQEMAFDPATQLISQLQDEYKYFYYRIGPNPFQMESALCFISKCKPVKDPQFIAFNIPGTQGGIRRGFFVVEFEQCYVITTHLDPHAHQGSIRAKQIEAILAHMKNLSDKSVVFMGDLNIESQDIEACKLLKEHFPNFKEQDVLHPTAENATCFDNLPQVARNPRLAPQWTVLDHILVRSLSVQNIFEEKVCTFDLTQLSQALSDHHAVTLKLV